MHCFSKAILSMAIAASWGILFAADSVTVWATECIPLDLSDNESRLAVGEVSVWSPILTQRAAIFRVK